MSRFEGVDHKSQICALNWWGGWVSNPRPRDFESALGCPASAGLCHLTGISRDRCPSSTAHFQDVPPNFLDEILDDATADGVDNASALPRMGRRDSDDGSHPDVCLARARSGVDKLRASGISPEFVDSRLTPGRNLVCPVDCVTKLLLAIMNTVELLGTPARDDHSNDHDEDQG